MSAGAIGGPSVRFRCKPIGSPRAAARSAEQIHSFLYGKNMRYSLVEYQQVKES